MEEIRFSPEEEIFNINISDDSSIYLISKG